MGVLEGKRALVTGGTTGLGLAIAGRFLRDPIDVDVAESVGVICRTVDGVRIDEIHEIEGPLSREHG